MGSHIRDSLDVPDFTLTGEETAEIAKPDRDERHCHPADEQPAWSAPRQPAHERTSSCQNGLPLKKDTPWEKAQRGGAK